MPAKSAAQQKAAGAALSAKRGDTRSWKLAEARRIVAGDGGELYWTEDHYESFEVIWR